MFPGSSIANPFLATSSFARSAKGGGGDLGASGPGRRPTGAAIPRTRIGVYEIEIRAALDLDLDAVAEPWARLAKRALAQNPFCEHALLAGAARHLPEGRRLLAILVWKGEALVGLAPATSTRAGFGPRRLAPWRVDLLPDATPLLDRDEAGPVLDALITFAGLRGATLSLADAAGEGPLADLLRARGLRRRPVPVPTTALATLAPARPFGTTHPEKVAVESARTARAVRDAVEIFLTLDAEVATARHANALVQDPGRANLVRTATRRAAHAKACRVTIARREGVVLAAAIVIRGSVWLTAVAPGAEGALETVLAGSTASAPIGARCDWTSAPVVSTPSGPARIARLVAGARRLLSPRARSS